MADEWTRERLQRHLDDQVQEDLNLDYKGAGSLDKSDRKKLEIHKDVSAMANSAGGVVIYGIKEYDDKQRRHLPERFDPVDQSVFTREWLGQVISSVQPRIQGLIITPVSVGPNPTDAVFVVEVPASSTAHQAGDKRYYRRYNFESVAMNDYEIRDVINRSTHALIDLEFKLELERLTVNQTRIEAVSVQGFLPSYTVPQNVTKTTHEKHVTLNVYVRNNGGVYAQYIVAYLYLPAKLGAEGYDPERSEDGRVRIRMDNNQRTYAGPRSWQNQNVPVLPGTREDLDTVPLSWDYAVNASEDAEIEWEVYADNAQVRRGTMQLSELRAGVPVQYRTVNRGPYDVYQ